MSPFRSSLYFSMKINSFPGEQWYWAERPGSAILIFENLEMWNKEKRDSFTQSKTNVLFQRICSSMKDKTFKMEKKTMSFIEENL